MSVSAFSPAAQKSGPASALRALGPWRRRRCRSPSTASAAEWHGLVPALTVCEMHKSALQYGSLVRNCGRVCSGRHAAKDCLDKRRLRVEQAGDVIASGGSRSVAAPREELSELRSILAATAMPRPSQAEESSASSGMPPLPRKCSHHLRGIFPHTRRRKFGHPSAPEARISAHGRASEASSEAESHAEGASNAGTSRE